MEMFDSSPISHSKTTRGRGRARGRGRPSNASLNASPTDDGFRTPLKRVSTVRKARGRPSKSSLNASVIDFNESFDDGIGLSIDDSNNDALNDSIAVRCKSRTNRRKATNKVLDSKFMYDRVIENIYQKYCNDNNDENIVNNNKAVKPQRAKRTNTAVMSARNAGADSDVEPIPSVRRRTGTTLTETKANKLTTTIMLSSTTKQNQSVNHRQNSTENEALVKYEDRKVWNDKEFQSRCLNAIIEMLSKRDASAFLLQINLKKLAMKTLGLPMLPKSDNSFPLIMFNSKGEPRFEFHFLCSDTPLHITERVNGYNHELFELNKIAYQLINDEIVYNADDDHIDSQTMSVEDVRNANDARKRIAF